MGQEDVHGRGRPTRAVSIPHVNCQLIVQRLLFRKDCADAQGRRDPTVPWHAQLAFLGPWPRRVSVLLLCLPLGVLRLGSRVCLTNCPIACSGVHPAMIHLQDFDGFKELAEFLRELGADTEIARRRRLQYFDFMNATRPAVYPTHGERWNQTLHYNDDSGWTV